MNPTVSNGTNTFHLDGQVFINKDNYWNVAFEIWGPQDSDYVIKTDYSRLVKDGTAERSLTKPATSDMVVNGMTYVFDGWYKDSARTVKANFDGQIKQRSIYYGKYLAKPQLTYKNEGQTLESKEHLEGTNLSVKSGEDFNLKKDGYVFQGWEGSDGELYEAGSSLVMPSCNLTLTAKWAKLYKVTYRWTGLPQETLYDENGNEVNPVCPVDIERYTAGQPYEVKAAGYTVVYTQDEYGNKTGRYTLGAWKIDGVEVSGEQKMGESDVKVEAEWAAIGVVVPQRLLTYEWTGAPVAGTAGVKADEAVTLPGAQQYVNGATYALDSEYTSTSTVNSYDAYGNVNGVYSFSGWSVEGSPETITQNLVAKGSWTLTPQTVAQHNVTYSWTGLPEGEKLYDEAGNAVSPMLPLNRGGLVKGQTYTVAPSRNTVVYTQDEYGNKTGRYTLGAWKIDGVEVSGEQKMGESDVKVTAVWTKAEIDIPKVKVVYKYVASDLYGIPDGAPRVPASYEYVPGQVLTVAQTPSFKGWNFRGWNKVSHKLTVEEIDDAIANNNGVIEIAGSWAPDVSALKASGYEGVYDGSVHSASVSGTLGKEKDKVIYRQAGLVIDNEFENANVTDEANGIKIEAAVVRDGVEIWSDKNVPIVIHKRPVRIVGAGWKDPVVYKGSAYDAEGKYDVEPVTENTGLVKLAKVDSSLTYSLQGVNAGDYTGEFSKKAVEVKIATGTNDVTGNYEVELVPGTLKIKSQSIEPTVPGEPGPENPDEPVVPVPNPDYSGVTVGQLQNVVYNGRSQQQIPEVLSADGAPLGSDDYKVTFSEDATNVGTVTVTIEGTGNYTGTVTRTYQITPAPLTISAVADSKVYGEEDPGFDWNKTGLIGEDPIGAVSVTRSNVAVNDAGLYEDVLVPNVAEADRNPNYEYTFVPADFRILASDENDVVIPGINDVAANSIVKTYDGQVLTVTATARDNSTVEYSVDGVAWTTQQPTFLNAGTYEVAVRATNPNYETVEKAVTVIVNRAPVTVAAVAAGKVAGTADPALSATVSGLVNGESASLIRYTVARAAGELVGSYQIVPTGLAIQGNYAVTYVPAILTISAAPVVPVTVTPAAVTPAPTPAAPAAPVAPAPAAPAPAAAPAAATPAPAAEPIEDDATPQAAAPAERTPLAETEEIEDEATPMGAFDEPHC